MTVEKRPRKQLRPVPPNPLKPIAEDLTRIKVAAESLARNLEEIGDEIFRTGAVPPGVRHGKLRDFQDIFPGGKLFGKDLPLDAVGLAPISELLRSLRRTREQIDTALEQAREGIVKAALGPSAPSPSATDVARRPKR